MAHLRQDKPQGFEGGKATKRGLHQCAYNCGALLPSRKEASQHYPCFGRAKTDEIIAEMSASAGVAPLQTFDQEVKRTTQAEDYKNWFTKNEKRLDKLDLSSTEQQKWIWWTFEDIVEHFQQQRTDKEKFVDRWLEMANALGV